MFIIGYGDPVNVNSWQFVVVFWGGRPFLGGGAVWEILKRPIELQYGKA